MALLPQAGKPAFLAVLQVAKDEKQATMNIRVRMAKGWLYGMRRVTATVCLALLALFLGYKVVVGANGMRVWQAKRAEAQRLQQEIDRMRAEQDALQHRVDGLQSGDPAMIEKEAREQLGYVKPGEVVLFEQKGRPDVKPPALADNIHRK
ncbi:MAG TPA: septum formation initiator family protein [Terriglobales bacterium]|nr:septum formation initiator family protein [Terriglobales bacterium]